ncbi:MAG: hypothetical protein LBF15_00840 [Candidatus Peribacteria bacterium]|nr:hypothetical protein [Candidatus Peribacteria bacterium]
MTKEDAKKLYTWAETGTYVLIDYNKAEYANIEKDTEVIKNYYKFLSSGKFEDAYNLRLNRAFSLQTLVDLNKNYNYEVIDIKQVDG